MIVRGKQIGLRLGHCPGPVRVVDARGDVDAGALRTPHLPLAYLLCVEGLALLRGWAGDFDRDFVLERLTEVRRLSGRQLRWHIQRRSR